MTTATKRTPTTKKTSPKAKKESAPDTERWQTQVYDPDGKWIGFFENPATAQKWIGKRTGYEITPRRPERKRTLPVDDEQPPEQPEQTDGAE